MLVAYHPMYPKLIGRIVRIMGPKGLAMFAKDTGTSVEQLEAFDKTGDINPIAAHIPVMWSKLFAEATPLEAVLICATIEKQTVDEAVDKVVEAEVVEPKQIEDKKGGPHARRKHHRKSLRRR